MSISRSKSSTSKKSTRVRTMNKPFPQDHLCRFLLAGNRRCQRVRGCTGSGLCILHDRQLMQLRDAESSSLGDAALGKVTDFNSAIAIHAVLSRVVILGLQRRYTTKEVSVFTYAIQSLRQTLDEAAYEIRHQLGHDSRDHYIGQAIGKEPSLRQPRQRRKKEAPTPIVNVSDNESVAAAQAPVGVGLEPAPVGVGLSVVGARLAREASESSPTAASANFPPSTIIPTTHTAPLTPTPIDPTESATALASIRTGLASIKTHIDSVKTSLVSATSKLNDVGVGLALPTAARKNSTPIAKLQSSEIPVQGSHVENDVQSHQDLHDASTAATAQHSSMSKAVCA